MCKATILQSRKKSWNRTNSSFVLWPALLCLKAIDGEIVTRSVPVFICWLVGYLCHAARQMHILPDVRKVLGVGKWVKCPENI